MVGSERRFEPWPYAIAALLLCMMAGSLTFLAVASSNPDPPVVEDAYVAGLQYNERLRAQRRAEALGVALQLEAEPSSDGAVVSVRLEDGDGAPVEATRVEVRRERPAEGGLDQSFELARDGDRYRGEIPLPREGRWRLVASADVRGETLRSMRSFRR